MKQVDLSYYSYLKISNNGLTLKSQWLQPNHAYNQYPGYHTINMDYTSSLMTSEEQERISRQEVDKMFATGNFTGYRAYNDLHTDYEKLVVIWWWITISTLFFNRAGVEGFSVIGVTTSKHAWNWVHLGEDWYAFDSTDYLEGLFLKGIQAEYHKKNYIYTGGELEWGFPMTDVDYKYRKSIYMEPFDKPILYQMEAKDSGRIGSNLKWTLKNGLLTIKGNGPMRDFENETLVPWKNFFDDITDLKIEEGVTYIGAYAFYNVKQLTYEKCKDKLGSVQYIGNKAFSDYEATFKDNALRIINNLKFLDEENKSNYITQISSANSQEDTDNIDAEAKAAANKNEEAQKTSAKNKINNLFLEEENKANYITQISSANTQTELNEIVSSAESAANENEKAQKTSAKNKINNLFLEEENKSNYITQISDAKSQEEINKIVSDAEAMSNKNEEAQKTTAKNKINELKFLEEENKANYITQISSANTQIELNEIVSSAESAANKNEEAQKTSAKNKIDELKFLEEENTANYTAQISNANSIAELNEIIAKAQSQNEEIKSNKKETVQEDIGKLENLGDLQQEYIDKLNNATSEQEFNQILQEAIAKNEEMKSNGGDDSKGNTNTAVAIAVPVAIVVIAVVVIVIVLVVRRKNNKESSGEKIYEL
ncbi:DUF1542 domain-containing protein [Histomonas meleagridis]|uniref:DUF1542 domain-containing protein n=1 Tax=Histomonas meleagridis TaxID=135588 RepID=UPI0035598B92|nr:DUF1542 domain-containing protein [Histomonas meleagridis]KAH0804626.1 DUF1542 domain-containing protein [Histomonas meleagridis]